MSNIVFFQCDCDHEVRPEVAALPGLEVQVWRPTRFGLAPPCGLSYFLRGMWPILHTLRILGNRDYAVVCLRRNDRYVHRTLLIPPFFRFPFMAREDLQCGDIWTASAERGAGLALSGLRTAMREAWIPGRKIWYLAEADNLPSTRLAQRAGFRLFGYGTREKKHGLPFTAQFVLTRFAQRDN